MKCKKKSMNQNIVDDMMISYIIIERFIYFKKRGKETAEGFFPDRRDICSVMDVGFRIVLRANSPVEKLRVVMTFSLSCFVKRKIISES